MTCSRRSRLQADRQLAAARRRPVLRSLIAAVATLACLASVPARAQNVVNVTNNRVGINTDTPTTLLHVRASDGTSKILVEEVASTVTGRTLYELKNNGNVRFFFTNTNAGDTWQMSAFGNSFTVDEVGDAAEFGVRKNGTIFAGDPASPLLNLAVNGNLTIQGVLIENSSREVKEALAPVDGQAVLARLAELPLQTWSYTAEDGGVRHLGPMAEDFHAAFQLGVDDKGLSPTDTNGVALAAIQGLYQVVQEKDREIDELRQRLAELEALVRTAR